ncbi:B12-binding domain-containing radical SAM protein [Opitutales bacterium]|nr:B12-binding domain-containing radical SAM protein [Opitutales bacterium]
MKKIAFIIPSWHYWADPFKLQPLWELYYATQVRVGLPHKDVSILDMRKMSNRGTLTEEVNQLPEKNIYMYWVMKSGDSVEIASIVSLLKKRFPESIHIAGGTHVDMRPNECAEIFDAIVTGPGEKSMVDAVNDAEKGHLKSRYEVDYKFQSFTITPYPQRDFLPKESIVNTELFKQYGEVPGTSMYMSRGCVYRCAYCVYNVPNALQVRDTNLIKEEIAYLKKDYDVAGINLRDEVAIHPNFKIFAGMMDAIGSSDIIWRGQTTSLATHDQLRIARETGCQELSVGVETVDDQVMGVINKKWQSEKKIRSFIESAKHYGIKIKMCLIFGLPGESRNIVQKTISFIEETEPDFVSLSGFCPVPGSPIFNEPAKYGIKSIDHDWSKHAHLLYRFSEEEEVGLPFVYEDEGPWGKNFTREEIAENIRTTQQWLNDRSMVY